MWESLRPGGDGNISGCNSQAGNANEMLMLLMSSPEILDTSSVRGVRKKRKKQDHSLEAEQLIPHEGQSFVQMPQMPVYVDGIIPGSDRLKAVAVVLVCFAGTKHTTRRGVSWKY